MTPGLKRGKASEDLLAMMVMMDKEQVFSRASKRETTTTQKDEQKLENKEQKLENKGEQKPRRVPLVDRAMAALPRSPEELWERLLEWGRASPASLAAISIGGARRKGLMSPFLMSPACSRPGANS